MTPAFTPVADHCLLVAFADEISEAAHAQVLAMDRAITDSPPAGWVETVPALVNLMVSFDVRKTDHAAVTDHLRGLLTSLKTTEATGVERQVQVCYEAPLAPDLNAVASATGLTPDAVVNAHLAGDYHVLMYGFAPGYAYLAGVPGPIQVPRKPAPLRGVPAGSIIIAAGQCLITTLTMPTGWSIIGRSPTQILTDDPDHPFLFKVGDRVRFERIDTDTFAQLTKGTADA